PCSCLSVVPRFLSYSTRTHPHLHSFPTRRSSDLLGHSLIKKISECQTQLTVCFREVRSLTEHRLVEVMGLHKKYEDIWGQTLREGAKNGIFCAYDSILLKSILVRSEEHTSELQSRFDLVCRL